jgi:hypothetical protein
MERAGRRITDLVGVSPRRLSEARVKLQLDLEMEINQDRRNWL